MENHVTLVASLQMIFHMLLEDILHLTLNQQQVIVIAHVVATNATDFAKKWANEDATGRDDEFKNDMIDVFCKCARQMKLKRVNRVSITENIDRMIEESK